MSCRPTSAHVSFSGTTTVNIGIIEGGQALNAWAEHASAKIFLRVTTSVADALQKLETVVAGVFIFYLRNNIPLIRSCFSFQEGPQLSRCRITSQLCLAVPL